MAVEEQGPVLYEEELLCWDWLMMLYYMLEQRVIHNSPLSCEFGDTREPYPDVFAACGAILQG